MWTDYLSFICCSDEKQEDYFCATRWLWPRGLLSPPGPGTWVSTELQVLLCTGGGESEKRQSARFLMDLVFQWLLSYSLKQGFDLAGR